MGFATDVGLVRPNDEDSLVVMEIRTAFESKTRKRVLLVVADGMGGAAKGEVASRIAITTITREILGLLTAEEEISDATYSTELPRVISVANAEILQYSGLHPEAEGMGTTVSMAVIDQNRLQVANVGDSRTYLLGAEEISQVTKDHSYVQELVDAGKITAKQARTHADKNKITRVVGYFAQVEVDTFSRTLEENEFVLVCCDGLSNLVEDEEMRKTILKSTDPEEACHQLIELAKERGGTDNISVIVAPASVGRS